MRASETSLNKFIQVALWAGQEEKKKFKVSLNHLKNHFLVFTQVAIWAGQGVKNDFKSHSTT